jgi:hypothetical protein
MTPKQHALLPVFLPLVRPSVDSRSGLVWTATAGLIVRGAVDGEQAGAYSHNQGPKWVYWSVRAFGTSFPAHLLVYILSKGVAPDDMSLLLVDHRDGNGLNNHPDNLRAASGEQNACNRLLNANNTSGFKGVYLDKASGRWRARVSHNGARRALGLFDTAEEAARAYDREAVRLHGAFASLNYPSEWHERSALVRIDGNNSIEPQDVRS